MKDCPSNVDIASSLPDFARNAHGNLAEQNRPVGPQRGADTTVAAAAVVAAAPAAVTAPRAEPAVTTAPAATTSAQASRNSQACVVQPDVSSLG